MKPVLPVCKECTAIYCAEGYLLARKMGSITAKIGLLYSHQSDIPVGSHRLHLTYEGETLESPKRLGHNSKSDT